MYPPPFGSKAAADCKGGSNDRPSVNGRSKPWQDRWTLCRFAAMPQTAASRRLAHGIRAFAITKDNRNVRYSSC